MATGQLVIRTNSFVELGLGINVPAGANSSTRANPAFGITANGAEATGTLHKVSVPGDIWSGGGIKITKPDGEQLVFQPLGLNYYDPRDGGNVLLDIVTNAVGWLTASNEIIFSNCFTHLKASIRIRNAASGVEHDIIFHERPPDPATLGLSDAARLEMLTEHLTGGKPVSRARFIHQETDLTKRGTMLEPDFIDSQLNFSGMRMGSGRAFAIASPTNAPRAPTSYPVGKSYRTINGRRILIEAIEYRRAFPALRLLPPAANTLSFTNAALNAPDGSRKAELVRRLPVLTAKTETDRKTASIRLVPFKGSSLVAATEAPAFILDYDLLNGGTLADFTFRGDTTYLVSDYTTLSGTITLQGGTVVKIAQYVNLYVDDAATLVCDTTNYLPAVFTCYDDDTVGEILDGSTGTPSQYLNTAFYFFTGSWKLRNVRFTHLGYPFIIEDGAITLRNAQVLDAAVVFEAGTVSINVFNGLFKDCGSLYEGQPNFKGEHITVHNATVLGISYSPSTTSATITNGLLVHIDNPPTSVGTYTETATTNLSSDSGVFESLEGGNHYLPSASPYRSLGTTNINGTLSKWLSEMTTYAPTLITGTLSNDVVLIPSVSRDTGTIGYHYPVVDYIVKNLTLENCVITLGEGVVVAGSHDASPNDWASLWLNSGKLSSIGTPARLNSIIRANQVQEDVHARGDTILNPGNSNYFAPEILLRFTDVSSLAGEPSLIVLDGPFVRFEAKHSQFFNGSFDAILGGGVAQVTGWTNNLLRSVNVSIASTSSASFFAYNNTFKDGSLSLTQASSGWRMYDNLLDTVSLTCDDTALPSDHNAYIGMVKRFTNDTTYVTNATFLYTNGTLGSFYHFSTNLLNQGSRNATNAALYHFTTTTDQWPETNSIVDIGYHYVALNGEGQPLDSNTNGIPNYLEDANGNGLIDLGENMWVSPPSVSLTTPTNGAVIVFSHTNSIIATATDSYFGVNSVEFYENAALIGIANESPYTITWTNPAAGADSLTAVAVNSVTRGTSSTVSVTVVLPGNSNLKAWFKADNITGVSGGGGVGTWTDSSGQGNDAVQASSSLRPIYATNALNGKPVVRFFGTNSFALPALLLGATQGEVFAVLKVATVTPVTHRVVWNLTGEPTYYPHSSTYIEDAFGSAAFHNIGLPAQPIDQYHLYNVSSRSGEWTARVNGLLQYSSTNNTVGFGAATTLGANSVSSYFDGDIAEIMVFDRTLTADERDALGNYLAAKYAFVSTPTAPTGLMAKAIASNQVSLTWNAPLTNSDSKFVIERKTIVGGTYTLLATADDGTSYLDGTVVPGTQYYYRVKAINYAGASDYSNEASTTPSAEFAGLPVNGLRLWLKGDAGHGANYINVWNDQSGNGNHATQISWLNRAQVVDNALNGKPVVRFFGTNSFALPALLLGATQGEVFAVLKVATVTPVTHRVVWNLTGEPTYYPHSSTYIEDAFGSAAFHNIGLPAQPIDQYHLYNVSSRSGEWTARVNGLPQYSTTNNTVGFGAATTLGANFDGDIAELMVFDRTLTTDERDAMHVYINEKYHFVPISDFPIELTASPISSAQAVLTWHQAGASVSAAYIVERRTGTNGPFQFLSFVSGDTHYFDEGLTPGTTYSYRVRDGFSANVPSNEETVQTFNSGDDFPISNVQLWLRASDVSTSNGLTLGSWVDFRNASLYATQATAANRPLWQTNVLNAQSGICFGSNSFFQLPDVLSNAVAADIFVVLNSATNSPTTNQGLWQFNATGSTWYPSTNGIIRDAFGSDQLHTNLSPFPDLTVPVIYNVASDIDLWRSRMNGPVKQLATTNSVTFNGVPLLGRSTGGAAEPFAGTIGELIIFDRVLTLSEQKTVRDVLAQKFNITLSLPHAPTNFAIVRTNVTDYSGTWNALSGSENGLESILVVERRADTNATFFQALTLSRTNTSFLESGLLPEITYGYRLKAINDVGEAVGVVLAPSLLDTDGDGLPDYLELLLGTNPNNPTDTDGDGLPDVWEVKYGLNPRSAIGQDGAAGDFDNDGRSNWLEYQQGTNPADGQSGDNSLIRLQVYRPR